MSSRPGPAWAVTIATPGSGAGRSRVHERAPTASTSSRSSSTSTAPAWRSTARVVRHDVASAPVCDRANSLTSLRPTTSATTGTVSVNREIASASRRPSVTDSTCSATAAVAGSWRRWSRTSAAVTSIPLPNPTARLTPCPASTSRKDSAWLTPPLAATTATRPAGTSATPGTKLAVRRRDGTRNPDVLGPSRRTPVASATSSRPCWCAAPAGPVSAKPPAHTSAARTPAAAASLTAAALAGAGTHTTARSSGEPSASAAAVTEPCNPASGSGSRELIRASGPSKAASERAITAPNFPGVRDAPMTAMPRGANSAARPSSAVVRGSVGVVASVMRLPSTVRRHRVTHRPGRYDRRARRSPRRHGTSRRRRSGSGFRSRGAPPRREACGSAVTRGERRPVRPPPGVQALERRRQVPFRGRGLHPQPPRPRRITRRRADQRNVSIDDAGAVRGLGDRDQALRERDVAGAERAPQRLAPPRRDPRLVRRRHELRIAPRQLLPADGAGEEVEGELPRLERVVVAPEVLPPRQTWPGRGLDLLHGRPGHGLVVVQRGIHFARMPQHCGGQCDRVLHRHLRSGADGEVCGVRGVAEQYDVAVVPPRRTAGAEVVPPGVVDQQRPPVDLLGEQLLEVCLGLLVAHPGRLGDVELVEPGCLPRSLVGLDDEGADICADRVPVHGEHAVRPVLVHERQPVEHVRRAEPDELRGRRLHGRLQLVREPSADPRVRPVGSHHEVEPGEVVEIHLGLEAQLDTDLTGALLQ